MILQKSLVYTILWLLFQLSVEINCQSPLKPIQRQWHTSTFIDNKIYILGGVYLTNDSVDINEFIYIDVSGPFNTMNLLWQDLSTNTLPVHSGATTVVGGANNNTLFLYGGNDNAMALVYTFDSPSKTWNTPNIAGATLSKKGFLTGVRDNVGNIYLFGGTEIISGTRTDFNDIPILDTINLSWKLGSIVGAPTQRINYGAVMLPNQNIIYLGKRAIAIIKFLGLFIYFGFLKYLFRRL